MFPRFFPANFRLQQQHYSYRINFQDLELHTVGVDQLTRTSPRAGLNTKYHRQNFVYPLKSFIPFWENGPVSPKKNADQHSFHADQNLEI